MSRDLHKYQHIGDSGLLPPDLQKPSQVQHIPGSSRGALIYRIALLPNSPAKQGVEVSFLGVKSLVFYAGKSKADGQHGKSEDEEAGDTKHNSPGVKPAHRGERRAAFRASEEPSPTSSEVTSCGKKVQGWLRDEMSSIRCSRKIKNLGGAACS